MITTYRIAFVAALLAAATVGGAVGYHYGRPPEAVEFLSALKWCRENITVSLPLDHTVGPERARLVCAGEVAARLPSWHVLP